MPRNLDQYHIIDVLPDKDAGVHKVIIRKKSILLQGSVQTAKHEYRWYSKKIEVESADRIPADKNVAAYRAGVRLKNRNMAKREVFAQELFRILLDRQPKTRYVSDHNHNSYVFSKGVENFVTFTKYPTGIRGLKEDILAGKVTGLGHALTACLWINEIDLHFGNIGVADNKVIKLDGDLSFGNLNSFLDDKLSDRTKPLEAIDLNLLPMTYHYGVYNWLDFRVKKAINAQNPILACEALQKNQAFKHEVNEGILRILLLSDGIVRKLTELYIIDPAEQEILKQALIARRRELLNAAVYKRDFIAYLTTAQCRQDFEKYTVHLQNFMVSGKTKLWSPSFSRKLAASFSALQAYGVQSLPKPSVSVVASTPPPTIRPEVLATTLPPIANRPVFKQ